MLRAEWALGRAGRTERASAEGTAKAAAEAAAEELAEQLFGRDLLLEHGFAGGRSPCKTGEWGRAGGCARGCGGGSEAAVGVAAECVEFLLLVGVREDLERA